MPITTFCRRMDISTTAYYRWLRDDLILSAEKENKIKRYINKLGEIF